MQLWFLQYISRVAWQTHRFFQSLENKRLHHLSEGVGGPGWLPKGAWCSWPERNWKLTGLYAPRQMVSGWTPLDGFPGVPNSSGSLCLSAEKIEPEPSTFLFRLAGQISLRSPRLGTSFSGWIYFRVPVSAPLVETRLTSRVSESAIRRENEK